MNPVVEPNVAAGVERPQLLTPFKAVALITAALVLVQALLAGRGWYLDPDLIEIHGFVGNAVFLAVLVQAALAFAVGMPASLRNQFLAINAGLIVLVVAQIGLGYSGRESSQAASLHIPNGVLIFGLTAYHLALLGRPRR